MQGLRVVSREDISMTNRMLALALDIVRELADRTNEHDALERIIWLLRANGFEVR